MLHQAVANLLEELEVLHAYHHATPRLQVSHAHGATPMLQVLHASHGATPILQVLHASHGATRTLHAVQAAVSWQRLHDEWHYVCVIAQAFNGVTGHCRQQS